MQTAKINIWLIGVALVAAPIFYGSDARAQTTAAGDTVLELQQLRAEIAELRDMLERQQYQIRRLQNQSAAGATTANRAIQPVSSIEPAAPLTEGPLTADSPAQQFPAVQPPPSSDAEQGAATTVAGTEIGSAQSTETPQAQPQTGDAAEDFYRPYVSDNTLANANPEVVSAARQARQADDTYPPVVDRSVGSSPASTVPDVATASDAGTPINAAGRPAAPRVQPPQVIDRPPQIIGSSNSTVLEGAGAGAPAAANQTPGSTPVSASNAGVIQIPTQSVPAQQAAPVVAEDVLYQQGFDLLKQFKYEDAVEVFKQQIAQYPQGGYADDAHYWVAESMYLNRNLPESKKYFRSIIDNFAQSPRVPDAMLKTAYIEQDQGNEIEARILLQEIIQYHPRSDAAISARNRLEKLN